MGLCDVSFSASTVWEIQRWLMVLCLSSDNPDQKPCCWDWYDQAVTSHALSPPRTRRTASARISGRAIEMRVCLAVTITACTVENINSWTRHTDGIYFMLDLMKSCNSTSIVRKSSRVHVCEQIWPAPVSRDGLLLCSFALGSHSYQGCALITYLNLQWPHPSFCAFLLCLFWSFPTLLSVLHL